MGGRIPGVIPRAQSRENQLSTAPTDVGVDPRMASQGGKNMEAAGSAISQASDLLSKTFTLAQQTRAQNTLERSVAEIEAEAEMDQDYSPEKEKTYLDRLNTATQEASGQISIPAARGIFEEEANTRKFISGKRIQGLFVKKAVDGAKAELATFLEQKKDQFITSNSLGERENAILQRDNKIDSMVSVGMLSREDGAKMKIREDEEWNKSVLTYDIETSPVFAKDELEKGEKGYYAAVPAETRVQMLDIATKRVEFLDKKRVNDTEDALFRASVTKTLTAGMLEEAALTGNISETFFGKMKKNLSSAIGPTAGTDKATYMNLVSMLLNPKVSPAKAREALLDEQTAGNLSPADFKKLYQMHLTPAENGRQSLEQMIGAEQAGTDFEQAVEEERVKTEGLEKKRGFLNSAVSFLQNMGGKNVMNSADMVKEFYEEAIAKNAQPEQFNQIARQVMSKQMMKAFPELTSYPKTGRLKVDAYGNKIRVFPDGTWLEEK